MRRERILGALIVAVLAAVLPGVWATTLRKVDWQDGLDSGTDTVVLTFDAKSPKLQVETKPQGLELYFAGLEMPNSSAGGLRVVSEAGGARLFLERPGAQLRSVAVEDTVVRVVMSKPSQATRSTSAYRIGVGDLIGVSVYKNPDLSGEFQVDHDGTFTLPLVGPVKAEGRTAPELADDLTQLLGKDYLVDPQVSVTVKTYQSQWIYVTGSVGRAVRIPLSPGMTLKDALSEAGVALGPGQIVALTRFGENTSRDLDSAGLEAADCPLPKDGDVLTVREPNFFYIQGEVRRPGKFVLTQDMTLLQAIAVSEGLTDWASKREVHIRRASGDETSELVVNLKKIEDRKDPDPALLPGDVILVKRKVL